MAKQPFENVVHYLFQIAAQAEFHTLNDQDLLKRYVEQRDRLAFAELLQRYKGMVWYVCWRVLRHQQDVEDAFQATVMTLLRRAKTLVGHASFEGWLHSTAYKVACTAKRDRQRQRAREERSMKMREESYDDHGSRWELGEVLDKELTHIPEKYRSALILCYLEELTWQEAAQRLGISLDSLEWRLEQGRKRLKQRLSKYGMDLGSSIVMPQTMYGVRNPEVPPGLMERTLDMVRIMTLSNGVLETADISPQVALWVKGTLRVKILLGSLFLSFLIVTAGAARYADILHMPLGTLQRDEKSTPATKISEEPPKTEGAPRRDLYGDPLPPGALARLGTERFRHDRDWGKILVFTPDSQAVGWLWNDFWQSHIQKPSCLWEVKTGKLIGPLGGVLRGQNYVGSRISFSADGRLIAYPIRSKGRRGVAGDDIEIKEVVTGKIVHTFENIRDVGDYTFALSPDGQTLVQSFNTAPDGGTPLFDGFCLWNIATGQKIWEQKIKKKVWEPNEVKKRLRDKLAPVFSPDSTMVARSVYLGETAESKEGSIELFDARTGKSLRHLGQPWNLRAREDLAFSSDSQALMVVYELPHQKGRCSAYLWDVGTGKERWHLDPNKEIHCYSYPTFSPDGKLVAFYEHNQSTFSLGIGLYEVATGKKWCSLPKLAWYWGEVKPLTFSPNGKVLATMWESVIRCWDVATGKVLAASVIGHETAVRSVSFAPDGRTLLSGAVNQSIHWWDSWTGQQLSTLCRESGLHDLRTLSWPRNLAMAPAVSANGKVIAGIHCDGRITDMPVFDWQDLLTSMRATVYIWDAATGHELRQLKYDPSITDVLWRNMSLSPNGKYLADWRSANGVDKITLWEVDTGKQIVEELDGGHPVFSPDSTCLLTHKGDVFTLWKAATSEKVASVTAVEFKNRPLLAVTPDWRTLACYSFDKKKRKWSWYLASLHQGQSQLILTRARYYDASQKRRSGDNMITSLALSPDGRMMAWTELSETVASSYYQGVIHLVETATGAERARFEGHRRPVLALSFSPDGRRLASGSDDTTILVWDVSGRWLDGHGQWRSTALSDSQVQQLWDALTDTDAARAGRAIWTLTAAPKQTLPFLAKHLSPVNMNHQPSAQQFVQLIKDLEDDKYAVRQKAFAALSKIGQAAEFSIRQTLEKRPPLEVNRQLKLLLGAIEDHREVPRGDDLRRLRAIEVLEHIGTPEACNVLKTLSQGAPGALQTQEAQASLDRLQKAVK